MMIPIKVQVPVPVATPNELPLIDIHLPSSVSWWPPAIGWWLLLVCILLMIAVFIWFVKKHQKKWSYRKVALKELKDCYQNKHSAEQQQTLHTMCQLLKRTAISAYPKADIGALQGSDWLTFLNQQTAEKYFSSELGRVFEQQLYQKSIQVDLDIFYYACQRWIKAHSSQHLQDGVAHV